MSPQYSLVKDNNARNRSESHAPSEDEHTGDKPEEPPTTEIASTSYILVLVILYAGFAIFAWTVVCVLTVRPIGTSHYGIWNSKTYYDFGGRYTTSENWYRAARVIQSITSVLTIPLTSAVCSSAAVIYLQQSSQASLRQLMTIADRGWTSPETYYRLVATKTGWKRHGSGFLLLAILLSILGGLIAPLQQIFLSAITIKTPTSPQEISGLFEIADKFDGDSFSPESRDRGGTIMGTRKLLEATLAGQKQSLLWHEGGDTAACNKSSWKFKEGGPCPKTGASLNEILQLQNPFLAPLPPEFTTGLLQQFLPRINSTASWQKIDHAQWPANCDHNGAYQVQWSNTTHVGYPKPFFWSLTACMPPDLLSSPWKPVRKRQDFTEELYLNITISTPGRIDKSPGSVPLDWGEFHDSPPEGSLFRVTMNTTAGYFELPNYMNQQTAGPLLAEDPNEACGPRCINQGLHSIRNREILNARGNFSYNAPKTPEQVYNKGPLFLTTLALFGEGSFLQTLLVSNPSIWYTGSCVNLFPLGGFIKIKEEWENTLSRACVDRHYEEHSALFNAALWLEALHGQEDPNILSNTFTAAAYLATMVWMSDETSSYDFAPSYSFAVSSDLGANTEKPTMSYAGVIVVSVLLAIDLVALFVLAFYASWYPRWTGLLDSFTMLRIGSKLGDRTPLKVVTDQDNVTVLDEIPGCVRDVTSEKEFGQVGLGTGVPLRGKRRYECYPAGPRGRE